MVARACEHQHLDFSSDRSGSDRCDFDHCMDRRPAGACGAGDDMPGSGGPVPRHSVGLHARPRLSQMPKPRGKIQPASRPPARLFPAPFQAVRPWIGQIRPSPRLGRRAETSLSRQGGRFRRPYPNTYDVAARAVAEVSSRAVDCQMNVKVDSVMTNKRVVFMRLCRHRNFLARVCPRSHILPAPGLLPGRRGCFSSVRGEQTMVMEPS